MNKTRQTGRNKCRKNRTSFWLLIMMSFFLTGCERPDADTVQEQAAEEEIRIPIILTVDPSTGKKNELDLVEAFNREYDGTYQLEVEWVMETAEEYRQNLKKLNVTDKLPAVITDIRLLPSYYELMITDGRIEELSPYLEADEAWNGMIDPFVLASCREQDGSIYLSPMSTQAFSCFGIFWNQELFERAGITKFPETWEEFWQCCDALEACGITPLALHTEGTGAGAMLIATAEMADTPEGQAFMEQLYPKRYQNESIFHMAETLQKMFRYTTTNALYSDSDVSYVNFVSGEAAMIANGYGMIEQIPEDMKGRVRFAPFPGNKLISSPETQGWAVASCYDENVKAGAVELLKLRARRDKELYDSLFTEERTQVSRIVQDYVRAYLNSPQIVPNYQAKWNSVLQEETLSQELPALAQNKITVEEFVAMLDESVREVLKE